MDISNKSSNCLGMQEDLIPELYRTPANETQHFPAGFSTTFAMSARTRMSQPQVLGSPVLSRKTVISSPSRALNVLSRAQGSTPMFSEDAEVLSIASAETVVRGEGQKPTVEWTSRPWSSTTLSLSNSSSLISVEGFIQGPSVLQVRLA